MQLRCCKFEELSNLKFFMSIRFLLLRNKLQRVSVQMRITLFTDRNQETQIWLYLSFRCYQRSMNCIHLVSLKGTYKLAYQWNAAHNSKRSLERGRRVRNNTPTCTRRQQRILALNSTSAPIYNPDLQRNPVRKHLKSRPLTLS